MASRSNAKQMHSLRKPHGLGVQIDLKGDSPCLSGPQPLAADILNRDQAYLLQKGSWAG